MKKQTGVLALTVAAFVGGVASVQFLPHVYGQVADIKKPQWQYGMNLQVRKANEANFTKDTQRLGIEVFKDENNGNLIYVAENGSIAVLPGK